MFSCPELSDLDLQGFVPSHPLLCLFMQNKKIKELVFPQVHSHDYGTTHWQKLERQGLGGARRGQA